MKRLVLGTGKMERVAFVMSDRTGVTYVNEMVRCEDVIEINDRASR